MFYSNLLNLKNITYKTVNYSSFMSGVNTLYDDTVLPVGYTRLSYNFDYSDGALKDGLGVSIPSVKISGKLPSYRKSLNIPLDLSIRGVWLFERWDEEVGVLNPFIVIYCNNNKFYYNDFHSEAVNWIEIEGLSSYDKPVVISYNLDGIDTLLIFSKSDGMYTWSYEKGAKKIENAPCINSMCVHYERLFVTSTKNERRLWFSDDLNPTNFNPTLDEGGFIDLVDEFGRANKVVSFEGYVYVFRDYNITRITAYAEQENFAVNQLYIGSGKILPNTVAMCGNKIIYLATDGLYSFNGSSSTRINLGINNIFDENNEYAVAGCSNGSYYLACRIKFDDDKDNVGLGEKDNNALIRLDINRGKVTILRGVDIRDISVINDALSSFALVVIKEDIHYKLGMIDNSGKVFDRITEKVWITPDSDFNYPDRQKLVKEVYLETKSDCTIRVKVDNKTKDFKVKGKEGMSVIKPRMKGTKVSVSFLSDTIDSKIANVQVRIGVL